MNHHVINHYLLAVLLAVACLLQGCQNAEITIHPALRGEPKLIEAAEPMITPAMAGKLPAVVMIELTVDETGQVIDALVIGSTDEAFEQAAVDTAMQYRYEPSTARGTIIKLSRPVGIHFKDPENPTATAKADIKTRPNTTQPTTPVANALPLAPIGKTSPGNPYTEDAFNMSGGIKQGKMNFVIKHESDNYLSELTITQETRYLRMKGWSGKNVFEGFVDTPEQRNTLNQDQRYILERMNQAVVLNN